jgi:hypothetical protein
MIGMTPTQRLEWIIAEPSLKNAHEKVAGLITAYEEFLTNTAQPEAVLVERFLDREISRSYFGSASRFGDQIFDVIEILGQRKQLHRLLVV